MMSDRVTLIPVDEGVEKGNITRETREGGAREVFGHCYGVGEREFYDASQAGFELALKVRLWAWDYDGERLLEWRGERYRVARTYDDLPHRAVELTCEKVQGRR
ncbi:MAG: hypothetical protein J6S60_09075 [Oscillospiraceae bacterium]|nr:hypothetical protein [Oscillospiraceae bacterium]